MTIETRVHETPQTLAEAVAEAFIARLSAIQAEGRVPVVGLTGGTIASAIHQRIASSINGFDVDWDEVEFWWSDERYVDSSSDERNAVQARRDLLDQIEADPERVHEMAALDSGLTLAEAAGAYADTLRSEGGVQFDVLFLGVGPDGHIGSLFPDSPGVRATDVITVAVEDSPKPPSERISLSLSAMARADSVWFVAAGTGKSDAVASARTAGPVAQLPARGVSGKSETVWWLDRAAASRL